MRRFAVLAAGAALAAAGVAAAVVVGNAGSAPPAPKDVVSVAEQNVDQQGLIRVHESGVAAVELKGTPTLTIVGRVAVDSSPKSPVVVETAREPFEQYVEATSSGNPACDEIRVPGGMRLTIDHFTASAGGSAHMNVYLQARVNRGGTLLNLVDAADLPLTQRPGRADWAGQTDALLFSGGTAPDGDEYAYEACIDVPAAESGTFTGLVSGWLEPA